MFPLERPLSVPFPPSLPLFLSGNPSTPPPPSPNSSPFRPSFLLVFDRSRIFACRQIMVFGNRHDGYYGLSVQVWQVPKKQIFGRHQGQVPIFGRGRTLLSSALSSRPPRFQEEEERRVGIERTTTTAGKKRRSNCGQEKDDDDEDTDTEGEKDATRRLEGMPPRQKSVIFCRTDSRLATRNLTMGGKAGKEAKEAVTSSIDRVVDQSRDNTSLWQSKQ